MMKSKSSLKITQINLQHCAAAAALLQKRHSENSINISMIQEPYLTKGGVQLGVANVYYDRQCDRPRTCIATGKEIESTSLPELWTQDCTAIVVRTKIEKKVTNIVVASVYLAYDPIQPPDTRMLDRVAQYANSKGYPLVVGVDANSHHMVWGSTDTNTRGEALLEYLVSTNLEFVNVGKEPTFVTSIRREVIDLTLANDKMSDMIINWRVSDEESSSDHRYLTFEVSIDATEDVKYRNPKTTDWGVFLGKLQELIEPPSGDIRNCRMLENETKMLERALLGSFHASCKEKTVRGRKPIVWWNADLTNLRNAVRCLFNMAKRTDEEIYWGAHSEAQKEYKRELRKAKRSAWKRYCEEINDASQLSRLNKVLALDNKAKLDVLKTHMGNFTESADETLDLLIETHFPGSVLVPRHATEVEESSTNIDWEYASRVVTKDRIRWAISSFSPFKSPGPDGIYPVLLQKGLEIIVGNIERLWIASIALGYIPTQWRYARAVFIPKPGKTDYYDPKSFRTISLTSFLLKGLEKVVDLTVKETSLVQFPLEDMQHAYQKGKSTETALVDLIGTINSSLDVSEYTLVVFFDIEGAFDRPSYSSIISALEARLIDAPLVKWIEVMLKGRFTELELKDERRTVRAVRGFAQGGVLSTLLWNLLVDSLLSELRVNGFETTGYADDGTIQIRGKFLETIVELMQSALGIVERWCLRHGLSVNPRKTEMMLFTERRKIPEVRWPTLFDVQLKLSEKVKYLGVYLDPKLSFKTHFEVKINRAIGVFWQCRRTFGRSWGLEPKMISWFYKCVVIPFLMYGAAVWWHRADVKSAATQLGKLQRLACVSITGAMKTTPTAALEALLDLPPLEIVAKMEAARSLSRIGLILGRKVIFGNGKRNSKTKKLMELNHKFIGGGNTDSAGSVIKLSHGFECWVPSREEWESFHAQHVKEDTITCYTDGSLMNGQAGAGAFIERLEWKQAIPLGSRVTVFQAEVYAIIAVADKLRLQEVRDKEIVVFSDSQAAIKALSSNTLNSKLVLECAERLNELGTSNNVKIAWVPGHSGFDGNECADLLARQGSEAKFIGPEPSLGWTYSGLKTKLLEEMRREHKEQWNSLTTCRQAKNFIKEPTERVTKFILSLKKHELRMLVQTVTGHGPFGKHMHTIGIAANPTCQQCLEEDEETAEHYLRYCAAFARKRMKVMGEDPYTNTEGSIKELDRILRFIKATGRLEGQPQQGSGSRS